MATPIATPSKGAFDSLDGVAVRASIQAGMASGLFLSSRLVVTVLDFLIDVLTAGSCKDPYNNACALTRLDH